MKPEGYLHATYPAGSASEGYYRLARVSACKQRATSMPLIVLEVPVKSYYRLAIVSACKSRATSMPLIVLEVSVKSYS